MGLTNARNAISEHEIHMECRHYLITPINRDDLSNDLVTIPITPVNRDDLSNDLVTLPYYSNK